MPYSDPLMLFLAQKKELVFQLMRLANDIELNEVNTVNAEKFIEFVDKREDIINKLKKVNGEIDGLQKNRENDGEVSKFDSEIKEMADQIARLEIDISKKSLDILAYVQKEIRDINKRKKVSSAYEL